MLLEKMQRAPERSPDDARRIVRCVLVVEDEVLLRLDIAEELRSAGYHVLEASTADEALEILGSGARVDLVFSDIQMPGRIDGLGLARLISERFARLPVVLTSGRPEVLGGDAAALRLAFLPKPYMPEEVIFTIEDELRRADG